MLWLGGATLPAQSPDLSFELLYRVERPVRFVTMDPLGQVYAVTPDNELLVFTPGGDIRFNYQNFRHGDLAWVDATNPLHLVLFYPSFGQVIVLDRTLSEIALLNLPESGYWDVPAVGRSADNQIWLYDPVQTALKKVSLRGETLVEGQPLSLLLPRPPQPRWIVEQKQEVFLFDPGLGVLVFDPFGQYLKTLPVGDMDGLRVWDEQWTFWQDGRLFLYYPGFQQTRALESPEAASMGMIAAGRMLLQTGYGFAVYGYQAIQSPKR
jgi:hypothetical protein